MSDLYPLLDDLTALLLRALNAQPCRCHLAPLMDGCCSRCYALNEARWVLGNFTETVGTAGGGQLNLHIGGTA